jgi:hypothetical protein
MDSKQLINQLVRNGLNLSDDQIKNLMVLPGVAGQMEQGHKPGGQVRLAAYSE